MRKRMNIIIQIEFLRLWWWLRWSWCWVAVVATWMMPFSAETDASAMYQWCESNVERCVWEKKEKKRENIHWTEEEEEEEVQKKLK